MKRKLLILICTLSAVVAAAQGVPDNLHIRMTVQDASSPYWYDKLFKRYMEGDTTLSQTDYHYLYYGYAFQDSYRPQEAVPARDMVLELIGKGGTMTEEDARRALGYAMEVMKADPFSPSNINFMTYLNAKLGNEAGAAVNADRFAKILAVIEASGEGTAEKSPWHVLWSAHGHDILMSRGLEVRRTYIISKDVEYAMLERRDEAGNKGYYFDYSRMYINWQPSPERVEGLQINGFKVGNKKKR